MARGVNKVILIGNIGQDPEVKFTPSGVAVANLSLATSESWTDKQTGQKNEKTEWHRLVAFNKIAEVIQQYVKKGDRLYIEGKLQTRKWQDQSGNDRYSTEILVNDLQMLGSPNGGQQQGGGHQPPQQQGGNFQQHPPQQAPQQQGGYNQNAYAAAQQGVAPPVQQGGNFQQGGGQQGNPGFNQGR